MTRGSRHFLIEQASWWVILSRGRLVSCPAHAEGGPEVGCARCVFNLADFQLTLRPHCKSRKIYILVNYVHFSYFTVVDFR